MKNKSILLTGADGALGSDVTRKLLNGGWRIYATLRNEQSRIKLFALFPDEINRTLIPIIADLSNPIEVKEIFKSVQDLFGLVHLAGGYKSGIAIDAYEDADFDALMHLNAKPAFLLLKEIVPMFKAQNEGSIVTIAAKPVLHQTKENVLYTASKSALLAITLSVAEDCRPFQVRANCIVPAVLQTKNNLSWADASLFKKFTPLEDISNFISFLMEDASKGITGNAIPMYHEMEW